MQEYLDKCFSIAKQIKDVDEDIEELQSSEMSPKNQIMTYMPKGGNIQLNKLELYIIELERLEEKKNDLIELLNQTWDIAESILIKSGITQSNYRKMMKFRYYHGYSWKKCAIKMKEVYPSDNWNENKCYRVHRSILYKNIQ